MAALVENMFYYRETPWHGLGKKVDEAPTSKDAIWMAGLDWEVVSKPIYDENLNIIPKYKRNVRSTDNSVLGVVSDKYKIVQNSEAFEFTDSLIGEGVKYETAGSLKNGKSVWLLAKMPEQRILGEDFEPYICFSNTHDGTGAIRVCMTPIRVVCNNTLNLALNTAHRMWSTKHMGNMQSKLAEAKHTLGLATDYMKALDEDADRLANMKLSEDELHDILDAMFPINYEEMSRTKVNNIITLKDNFFQCYNRTDIVPFKGTVYGAINAATDMVAHMPPSRMTKNYQENNWGKIMVGHPFVDTLYKRIAA